MPRFVAPGQGDCFEPDPNVELVRLRECDGGDAPTTFDIDLVMLETQLPRSEVITINTKK